MKRTLDNISAQIGPDKTIGLLVTLSQENPDALDSLMDDSIPGTLLDHKKGHGNGVFMKSVCFGTSILS